MTMKHCSEGEMARKLTCTNKHKNYQLFKKGRCLLYFKGALKQVPHCLTLHPALYMS